MTPSVRGRRRWKVAAALAASAGAGATVAGVALAIAWRVARLPPLTARAVAGMAGAALLADLAHRRIGRPRPPSLRSQVPRQWAHLFDPRVAAGLYGARLGVGPLTILATWLWWVSAAAGASHGPAASAATGAVFGLTRIAVVLAVSHHVERAMAPRMAALRASERLASPLIGAGVVVTCVLALV